MAGETFYTYLHGPRTFWGNSGSNIRINNNFGFPCTPPMMWGCGCNHGSGNSIWPAMMMFNSMMAQTIPYWNFGKSEGAGASDTAGTTAYLDKLTTARQTLDQIGFTKAEGYGLYLDENNNIVYRYIKDGKEYTASSMAELTAKISTGATGAAEGAGSSEDTSDNAATVTLRDSIASGTSQTDESDAAEETTSTDSTDATDSADSTASSGNTHSTSGARRAFKRGNLNNGWEWTTYSKLPNGDLKTKISKADCKTAVDILKAIYPNWADKSETEIKGSASYKLLMDANPGAIDNDGKIVNKNKLDLFVKKAQSTTTKTAQQKAREKKLLYEQNGYTTKISVNGRDLGIMASLNNNARLTINSGKLKGSWQIKYSDGDYVDYSDVNWTGWGPHYNARRLYVGTRNKYNITSIDCFDSANGTTKTKSIPARYDNNNSDSQGRIEVQIDGKWIPLEDAMRMQ